MNQTEWTQRNGRHAAHPACADAEPWRLPADMIWHGAVTIAREDLAPCRDAPVQATQLLRDPRCGDARTRDDGCAAAALQH